MKAAVFRASPDKAPGRDGLPARVWRELWPVLDDEITQLFAHSLATGRVPKEWKVAKIVPLQKPKRKDSTVASNYRPISLLPTLGKALQYALTRYLDDRHLSIDNNLAERRLRGIAVTRKNHLFVGSDAGGERATIIYTIGETAKLNGLDPEAYIASVLTRLASGHPITSIGDLLPWNFRPAPQSVVMS